MFLPRRRRGASTNFSRHRRASSSLAPSRSWTPVTRSSAKSRGSSPGASVDPAEVLAFSCSMGLIVGPPWSQGSQLFRAAGQILRWPSRATGRRPLRQIRRPTGSRNLRGVQGQLTCLPAYPAATVSGGRREAQGPVKSHTQPRISSHVLIRFTPRPSAFTKTVATGLTRPVALFGPSLGPAAPSRPALRLRPTWNASGSPERPSRRVESSG